MMSSPTSRVLVVCNEVPEPGTAGETDRCWALAEALSANHDVILALPKLSGLSHGSFAIVYYNSRNIAMVARDSDVVICDPPALALHQQLLNAGKPVAVDLAGVVVPRTGGMATDPGDGDVTADPSKDGGLITPSLADVLAAADFFICTSEDERRGWLQTLEKAGRVNEHTLDGDSGLRRLIEVVRVDHLQPLMDYCAIPRFARDRGSRYNRLSLPAAVETGNKLSHYWRRFRYLLRTGGIRAVWSRCGAAIKRKTTGKEQS